MPGSEECVPCNDGEQVRRQNSSADADEPMCRICFETGSDGESGPLFRPCSCRGSMAWVHMECLDHWRKSSVNPRSFYRCDQCHFEYRFGRVFPAGTDKFMLARFLSSRFAVHVLSVFVLLSIIFCGGFVAKMFNGELTWYDVLRCFNLEHMISGSVVTGMGSLLGWVLSLLGGGGGRWVGDVIGYGGRGLGGGGGGGNDKAGKIIVVILVVIGLCIAFKWIYDRIEHYAQRTTRMATHVVLDAHHGREPPAVVPAAAPAAAGAAPRRRAVSPARPRPRAAPIAVD